MNGVEAGMTDANDQHEPSYYEIALTNRQVMVAFVILLLCVLGAFFSGVWVGRGGSGDRHPAASSTQAQAVPPGQPLQELQFFNGGTGSSGGSGAKPAGKSDKGEKPEVSERPAPVTSSPDTSMVTDLAKPDAGAAPPPATSGGSTPAASTGAASTAPAAATPSPAVPSSPAPAPLPAPTTATPSAALASATGASAASGTAKPTTVAGVSGATGASGIVVKSAGKTTELAPGEMVVQVFSSSDGAQAKKTLLKVNTGGFKAYLSPLTVGVQTMYRVRIGPFTDRAAAQKVADQVRKKFKLDTWITR
jgi:DedD protein